MEVQVLSSAPRFVSAARRPSALVLLVAAAATVPFVLLEVGCSRESSASKDANSNLAAGAIGTLTAQPPQLLALPASRPDGVVRGKLVVRLAEETPAGSAVRIRPGYDEHGQWLGGTELRYALEPAKSVNGRAFGVAAHLFERGASAASAPLCEVAVTPLAPADGWLEAKLPRALRASEELVVELGAEGNSTLGPASSVLPVEVELCADLVVSSGAPRRLAGRVPVRVVDPHADWLRVIGPAQARVGQKVVLQVLFQTGFSGPMRASLESLVPAGTLEVSGPFPTFTTGVAAETVSTDPAEPSLPHAARVELPPLPAGVHRIALRFHGGAVDLRGLSNPIRVGDETPLFFGSLHGHTTLGGHATSTPSRALRYARDVVRLDFVGLSEHRESTTFDAPWLAELARDRTSDGSFVVFSAWEWTDANSGHRHVVHRDVVEPPPSPADLASFAKSVGRDQSVLVFGHHSIWNGGTAQRTFDWGEPGALPRQKVGEVYSWHGESLVHDSPFPMHGNHDQELAAALHSDVLSALASGHRLFLNADGDNHLGKPGALVGIEWPKGRRYAYLGLTAVRAPRLERHALFDAMDAGELYGTTGARVVLDAKRTGPSSLHLVVHGSAPLGSVAWYTPTRPCEARPFPKIERDAGLADAPLFLDPSKGTWDAELDLTTALDLASEPWIVEVAQQDFHRAWLLLAPDSWSAAK